MTDRTPTHEVLRQQKVAALALNYEFAALRVRLAALKLQSVLERNASVLEARFNPYHDDLGRFTTADGAGSRGGVAGPGHGLGGTAKPAANINDGRVRVAQVEGEGESSGRYRDILIEPMSPIETRIIGSQNTAEQAVSRVWARDPTWRAPTSVSTGVGTVPPEQELAHYNRIIDAAEARLREIDREGIGGNGGPALELVPGGGGTGARPPGQAIFSAPYRAVVGMPELVGPIAKSKGDGTVALAEFDGKRVFGVNSDSPGYDVKVDEVAAKDLRASLIAKYPNVMNTVNIGRFPNTAVFHAETTVLLRAARANGGSLSGRNLQVRVDRPRCLSCDLLLPKIGLEIGNPTVTFISPNGSQRTMRDGRWVD